MNKIIKKFINFTNHRKIHWNARHQNELSIKKVKYYDERIYQIYSSIVPPRMNVLEIGCGVRPIISKLDCNIAIGIDFSKNAIISNEINYPHCKFYEMDAHEINLGYIKFDYILLSDLICDIWDIQKVFNQIYKYQKYDTLLQCML